MRIPILIFSLFFSLSVYAGRTILSPAEQVLEKLYEANGNHKFPKPKIRIVQEDNNAALFLRRSNTIELSEKAYQVCRSFGKDSLSALAFMLGHELAHAFQPDFPAGSTSFLAYDRHHDEGLFFEESADVKGLFMAYLAGYRTIEILPEVIERIYRTFNLPAKLTGYPTLAERQYTTRKVQEMTTELIRMYEAGNHLLAIGKYDLAVSCFQHVENWYQGREVYNNLGIGYTYLAMNFTDQNPDPYLFPLEISWSTRMKKPLAERGVEDLDAETRQLRMLYLNEAHKHFLTASAMDISFVAADINLMCVLVLMNKPQQAIEYFRTHRLRERTEQLPVHGKASYTQLRLALALAFLYNQESDRAIRIWSDIEKNGSGLEAYQAGYNRKVWGGKNTGSVQPGECPEIPGSRSLIDGVKLHRPETSGSWVSLQPDEGVQVSLSEKSHSLVYTFNDNGRYFTLQRVFNAPVTRIPDRYNEKGISTRSGMIMACEKDRISFLLDEEGMLLEWAKYY